MTELPTPTIQHDGLVFDGWNWTLAEVQAAPFSLVGAHYRTDDGDTRIYLNIPIVLRGTGHVIAFAMNKTADVGNPTITVDWGDGLITTETLTSSGGATTFQHVYSAAGNFVIRVRADMDGACFTSIPGSSYCFNIFAQSAIEKIEVGERILLTTATTHSLRTLKSITMPNDAAFSSFGFYGNLSLNFISFPRGATTAYYGSSSQAAKMIILPPTIATGQTYLFSCLSMYLGIVAGAFTSIPAGLFQQCILTSASGLKTSKLVFLATTPPTMAKSGSAGDSNHTQLYVPDGSVSAYQAATNWSAYSIKSISELIAELRGES